MDLTFSSVPPLCNRLMIKLKGLCAFFTAFHLPKDFQHAVRSVGDRSYKNRGIVTLAARTFLWPEQGSVVTQQKVQLHSHWLPTTSSRQHDSADVWNEARGSVWNINSMCMQMLIRLRPNGLIKHISLWHSHLCLPLNFTASPLFTRLKSWVEIINVEML